MERNYVVTLNDGEGGRSEYVTTADIKAWVRGWLKGFGLRAKGYEVKRYAGHWCDFHEWTLTRGRSVVAHEY